MFPAVVVLSVFIARIVGKTGMTLVVDLGQAGDLAHEDLGLKWLDLGAVLRLKSFLVDFSASTPPRMNSSAHSRYSLCVKP
jgi:hypothetical protein